MVFPYYPRPEDDTQEPEEERQQQGSPSYRPFYLSYIYPAPPAPDPGYVAPGESHPLPSGPTTHPELPQTEAPKPNPVTSPPPFDSGPSPYLTQEATSSAQPASSDEEADRRKQRIAEAWQRFEAAKQSASNAQVQSDFAQTETLPDIDENVLRYVAGVGETTVHHVDMDYQIAAQYNAVLHEARLMVLQEGVPPALDGNPDLLLSLCGEFGMDEENDAEARAFLHCWTHNLLGSDFRRQSTYNPVLKIQELWIEAHAAFDPESVYAAMEVTAYREEMEAVYGIRFTHAEGATPWDRDPLGLLATQFAVGMLARVLGESARRSGWHLDDASAFRAIMGDVTIHNSLALPPMETSPEGDRRIKASAEVVGQTIHVFWNEKANRNFHLNINVMLHELGHIYNSNAGFGDPYSPISINMTSGHPDTRDGMGAPDPDETLKHIPAFFSTSTSLPPYDEILKVPRHDKICAHVPEYVPKRVLSLRQSDDQSTNEVTADAVVNWVYDQISEIFGFTDDADGLA